MEAKIELSTITDPKELKSLAYDQIAAKEEAENNLRAINQRLLQVLNPIPAGDNSETVSSVSDDELGIEASADKPDAVE